jgi:hypothetical protein
MNPAYLEQLATIEVIVAVCADQDKTAVIVKASVDDQRVAHLAQFDDILAKDNYFTNLPEEPGVYRCQARYSYIPPDEWEYLIVDSVKIV